MIDADTLLRADDLAGMRLLRKRFHPKLARAQLKRAYEAQRAKCCYCKCDTVLPDTKFRRATPCSADWPRNVATREHLVRRCEGGSDEDGNVAMACAECNWARG